MFAKVDLIHEAKDQAARLWRFRICSDLISGGTKPPLSALYDPSDPYGTGPSPGPERLYHGFTANLDLGQPESADLSQVHIICDPLLCR